MKSMLALLLFAIVAVPSYSFGGVESDAGLFRSLFSSTAPQNVKDAENFQAALIQNYILSYDDFKKVLLRRDVLKNDGKIYEFVSAKGEKRITTIGYDYLAIEMGYTNAVDEQIKIFSPQIRDSKLVNEIRPMVNLALKYLTEALRAKVNNENEIELQLYQIRLAKMAKELTIQIDRSGLGYYASFDSNENILKISPAVILKLPPAAQIFVLAHEFGHTLDFFDILMAIDGDGEFIAEEQDLLELLPFKEDKALKNYYVKSIVPVKLKIEKLVKELKNSQRVVQLNIKPEMLDPINKVINGEIPYAQRVAFGIYIRGDRLGLSLDGGPFEEKSFYDFLRSYSKSTGEYTPPVSKIDELFADYYARLAVEKYIGEQKDALAKKKAAIEVVTFFFAQPDYADLNDQEISDLLGGDKKFQQWWEELPASKKTKIKNKFKIDFANSTHPRDGERWNRIIQSPVIRDALTAKVK